MKPTPDKNAQIIRAILKAGITPIIIWRAMSSDVSQTTLQQTPPHFTRYTVYQVAELIKLKISPKIIGEVFSDGLREGTLRVALKRMCTMRILFEEKTEHRNDLSYSLNNKYFERYSPLLEIQWKLIEDVQNSQQEIKNSLKMEKK